MSYVGRVTNPSGLTMQSQRAPNYSMGKSEPSISVKVTKAVAPKLPSKEMRIYKEHR